MYGLVDEFGVHLFILQHESISRPFSPMKIHIVTCSRANRIDFGNTLLGKSLPFLGKKITKQAFVGNDGKNALGLPDIYNRFIHDKYDDSCLVFVHDDVAVTDWHLLERLEEALTHFDIVGVAGNAHPKLDQPSWALTFDSNLRKNGSQPNEHFSGVVHHKKDGRLIRSTYGPWPRSVKVLDGLFIAVRVSALLEKKVTFDPLFRFHCYDIDFCRSADEAGLKIGTWPISLIHGSTGNFDSDDWRLAARLYLEKWDLKAQKTKDKLLAIPV